MATPLWTPALELDIVPTYFIPTVSFPYTTFLLKSGAVGSKEKAHFATWK